MEINNNLFTFILQLYCWLNFVAVVLGAFRSDAHRIAKDLSNFFRLNKWYVTLGVVIVIFTMSPFTIPFTIKNIIHRINSKNK
jgi:hypothetical protein